jgi:Septum formation initiator.
MASRRTMYYTEGSVVRKREVAVPERRQDRREGDYHVTTHPRAAAKAEKSLGFDGKYMFVISLMTVIMLVSCFVMLKIQNDVTTYERQIVSLQNQLQTVQSDNIAFENSLNNMYSLDEIYKIATGELGMIYSQEGQIVYYESSRDDYVTQYKDVPETGR